VQSVTMIRETLINSVAGGDGREQGCFGQISS
jgi:hypothetical protein